MKNVVEEAERGIALEFASFFDAINGKDDGLGLEGLRLGSKGAHSFIP